ncbi:hypothetical protein AB0K43_02690 [Kitasatospora sp. NPDC049258]|uniref:hypothetical protein n=1 Tax=Kitasatospora sp. NPDC049258 TaxID=3155394 RepID=UPI003430A87C
MGQKNWAERLPTVKSKADLVYDSGPSTNCLSSTPGSTSSWPRPADIGPSGN